ncbi:DNA primase [Priestia endophytica]
MSDFQQIKYRIFNEGRVNEVLEHLGCWNIHNEQNGKLIVGGLPDGDNDRSVQVRNNEGLSVNIRSKGINGSIFDLASYILYEAETEEERIKSLHKAKYWICETLNYMEFIDDFYKETSDKPSETPQYTLWLDKLKKKRTSTPQIIQNEVLDESVLEEYETIPYLKWYQEGLSLQTQRKFQIGLDIKTERVTFPIHNKQGELIGVKGRYCGSNEDIEKKYKYLYLRPCNKSIEFFNLHRALPHIKAKKEVIVLEGGKTTMYLDQWGIHNSISTEGDSLTEAQIKILEELGLDIKFIFMWDKDKGTEFIKEEAAKLKGRLKYAMYDSDNLLSDKDSPSDRGKQVFMKLYKDYIYRI